MVAWVFKILHISARNFSRYLLVDWKRDHDHGHVSAISEMAKVLFRSSNSINGNENRVSRS